MAPRSGAKVNEMTHRKAPSRPAQLAPATAEGPLAPPRAASKSPAHVVGIGASGGGLEAFEQFFRRLPADTGRGFILVPHLDRGHASIRSEIIWPLDHSLPASPAPIRR
jgi:chemotaxis response regulator CheB